ncbi:MAG: 2Fe-2S iron-sulfur cluster-binding protein [Syntrophomonadaceae bacterium]
MNEQALAAVAPSSVLAAVTTIHLALGLVRRHRTARRARGAILFGVSLLFAASVWAFPSFRALAIGGAAHLLWFVATGFVVGVKASRGADPPMRTAAAAATTPAATAVPASRPAPAFAPAAVLAVFDETPEIRTFRVARPEGFEFRAGQFLTVRVQLDGHAVTRCYSISSSPSARGYLEISVRRQGVVSQMLHATLRPGSTLAVRGPAGAFVYPEADERPLVLISGGVGCTPMISMLRHAIGGDPTRPVVFLFSAKTEADIAFRHELALIARRHPQVRVVIALTRATGSPQFYAGRIDEKLIRQVVPDPLQSLFYVCGPAPMIEGTKAILKGMGVPGAQVRSEAFAAAVAASRPDAPPSPESPEPAVPVAAGGARTGAPRLRLAVSGRVVTVARGQTLLEAAEAASIEIPNSCRGGVCGTCRTRVISGEVECEAEALTAEDREQGYVFPCVAWAKGDCVLDV